MSRRNEVHVSFLSSIGGRLVLFAVCVVVVTAVTVGFLQYRQHVHQWEEQEYQRLGFGLQKASTQFLNVLEGARRQVLAMSGLPAVDIIVNAPSGDPDAEKLVALANDNLKQVFVSIAHSNPELLQIRLIGAGDAGKEIVRVNRRVADIEAVPDDELQAKGDRPYVSETLTLRKGQVRVSNIDLNRELGVIELPETPVLRISTPVFRKDGKVAGLVIVNLDLRPIFVQLTASFSQGRQFLMTNHDGLYLVAPDSDKAFAFEYGRKESLQKDFPTTRPFFDSQTFPPHELIEGQDGPLLMAFRRVHFDTAKPDRYVVMVSSTLRDNVLEANRQVRRQFIIATIALTCLGAAIAIFVGGLIVRPLKRLTQAVHDVTSGKTSSSELLTADIGLRDEVGALARAFRGLLISLRARQIAVEEKQEHLHAILSTAVSPIVVINEAGIIQEANQATTRLFGYPLEMLLGNNVSMLMTDMHRTRHDQYLRNYRRTGIAQVIGIGREVEGLHRDGSTIPLHLAVSEVRHEGRRVYAGIITDLSERYRADKVKNEFISTVSHELRTPLTSIKGALGLLRADVLGNMPEQAKTMIDIAFNNCERLVRLVNDLLDIEKIRNGKLTFRFEEVDVVPFLMRMLDANRSFADEFHVELKLAEPIADVTIDADPDRLAQVVTNLLSNAIKFSPVGETVELGADVKGDRLVISVRDHGPGIPEGFQAKIFTKFSQADASDTKAAGGSGLGLAISKAIAEGHGGMMDYETEVGKGSTFRCFVPLRQSERAEGAPPKPTTAPKPKILICDDDPDMGALLKLIVERMGFYGVVCTSASDAKDELGKQHFAGMTLDLAMPGQNGLSLISELKRTPATHDLPIIVVSAHAEKNAKAVGSSPTGDKVEWLAKPLDIMQFRMSLSRLTAAERSGPPKILHVEDDKDLQRLVAHLVGSDALLDCANSWDEARRYLTDKDYDLVILDLALPDGRGEDLMPLIQANGLQPPHVFVFSAKGLPSSLLPDVDSHLLKTDASEELIKMHIEALLGTDDKGAMRYGTGLHHMGVGEGHERATSDDGAGGQSDQVPRSETHGD